MNYSKQSSDHFSVDKSCSILIGRKTVMGIITKHSDRTYESATETWQNVLSGQLTLTHRWRGVLFAREGSRILRS